MTSNTVSVIIVSRHRPEELRKCVRALEFQTFRNFEVVIVADPDTAADLNNLVPVDRLKAVNCLEANISKARNIGISQSAGDIVAFIDDDAIAEPTWLERLISPLIDTRVAATGGYVRGRNGISLQWGAEEIDRDGVSHPIIVDAEAAPDRAIKTQGTNCAFRRNVLIELGGFDENFHFYLDEADVNFRIGQSGRATAIVPEAEVQHGFARSSLRGADRRPRSLFEIGASQAYYVSKHAGSEASLESFKKKQWRRLEEALVQGLLEPRDVRRLWSELEAGMATGQDRLPVPPKKWLEPSPFKRFVSETAVGAHRYLSGRRMTQRHIFALAAELSRSGTACTAIILSSTGLFHRRWFHVDGFWVQSGGVFGKSSRSDSIWAWYTREDRIRREQELLGQTR
ncbi:glycosyltransferase family 2 protein [Litoreibacter janthinus]|uniref:Glycosyltransferase like family 2 n=1 Tax=Litoreibacter janthinus TaxID=670154 RepID=A0A1I6FZC2_9RHOB|nr:glycosyltransferase [Litoreibacter janthinus]SFR35197.1 Glycosyltransferase like family 2 [Litoreibacter janthinus]